MRPPTAGLHHVSAIASDPQANVEFYTDVLGLRFVKRTVNFDDKFAYHLYYGDDQATPGTLLTFFPYPRGDDGRIGRPQPRSVAFSVPEGSASYWYERLLERGVDADEPTERFGEPTVAFRDPDGLGVELVERDDPRGPATDAVPRDRAIRNFHSVALLSTSIYHSAATLEVLGFELLDQEGDQVRYRAPGEYETDVDLLDVEAEYGRRAARRFTPSPSARGTRRSLSGATDSSSRAWSRHSSRIATTASQSTSASPAASSSRLRPPNQDLRSTRTSRSLGRRSACHPGSRRTAR